MRNVLWKRGSTLRFFSPYKKELASVARKHEALIAREGSGAGDALV